MSKVSRDDGLHQVALVCISIYADNNFFGVIPGRILVAVPSGIFRRIDDFGRILIALATSVFLGTDSQTWILVAQPLRFFFMRIGSSAGILIAMLTSIFVLEFALGSNRIIASSQHHSSSIAASSQQLRSSIAAASQPHRSIIAAWGRSASLRARFREKYGGGACDNAACRRKNACLSTEA